MHHAVDQHAEREDILTWISDFSFLTELLISFVYLRVFPGIGLTVHIRDSKAQRHGLTQTIAFPSLSDRESSQHGKVRVSCGIDKIVRINIKPAGFVSELNGGYPSLFRRRTREHGMKQEFDTSFRRHTVQHDFQIFLIKGNPVDRKRTDLFHLSANFCKQPLRKNQLLPILLCPIRHKRIHETVDRAPAKRIALFCQQYAKPAPRRAYGRGAA